MKKILRKIKNKKIVSFDIFDTLIKRSISNPHDVFDLVEIEYNKNNKNKISGFKKKRIEAERKCRIENNIEEINIKQIYEKLQEYYSKKIVNQLIELEKKIEIDICFINNEIINIYNWCKNNKRIVITSDMYLDYDTIRKILEKNNIIYEKLYVSSEVGTTKNTGNLFEYIVNDLKIEKKDIIHIGDNYKSDYINGKLKKISTIRWKKSQKKTKKFSNMSENIMTNFLYNKTNKDNLLSTFGYSAFGPLLLSFCIWLKFKLIEEDIKQVFFFSRDGYIMKRAFDILNINTNIESNYFYASRRSIIVPSLHTCKDINEIFSKMHFPNEIDIKTILKKIGLDDQIAEINFLKEYNVDINQKYKFINILEDNNIKNMFKQLYPKIIENSKKEYESFLKYKNKMNFKGKIAIVDIGWFGNMQHALEALNLNTDISGFYMGIEPRKNYQKIHKMSGFLFETNKNYNLFLKEHNFNSIFELLFLACHGSVKRFDSLKESNVELYPYEYENSKELCEIMNIQNAAIEFVNDFFEADLIKYMNDDLSFSFDYICNYLLYPTLKIAKTFGNFNFLDYKNSFIAKPRKIINYVNLKNLIYDYKNSTWRVGFLKRLIKIPLPYYKINMYIRKKYLNKRGEQ